MTYGPLASYQSVQIGTADPAALVVQLFDGALRFLARARRALASGDQAGFAFAVNRAHAIVVELSNALDREAAGDTAEKLDSLYAFMMRHLTEGLIQRSASHVERVASLLTTLREAFDEARRR
jgi:flagellar protein FliS